MKNQSRDESIGLNTLKFTNGQPAAETVPDYVSDYIRSVLKGNDEEIADLCCIRSGDLKDAGHRSGGCRGLVNLHRLNDILHLNPFLERVNERLPDGSCHVVCLETKNQRKQRLLDKYPAGFNRIYYALDFVLKRVFPKWRPTRDIYFRITGGRNRVMTRTEAMGRLVSCGFSIVDVRRIDMHRNRPVADTASNGHPGRYLTYIITRKTGKPAYDRQPTYGALCKLRRIGKGGKPITVYKLRTMHPYSEYLQQYLVKRNDLQKGGKINNDFRITSWGRLFRKLWIDELPMLLNWIRGDMKLVGVRPLSPQYYSLYPEDVRELRNRVHPGLVPPFYADLPETLEEIVESERAYLEAYLEKPLRTDLHYFCKAAYNILIKRARSG